MSLSYLSVKHGQDHNRALLQISSRGPVGGSGPTVVSYGNPIVEYIKDGWNAPIPSTSYATPRVARVAIVILRAMQLLWSSYEKISNSAWNDWTEPLTIPTLGFLDTWADFSVLPPLPDQVAEHLSTKGKFVSFPFNDRQRRWFERIHMVGHSCQFMAPTIFSFLLALRSIATPLPSYKEHEIGAGFVDYGECYEFLRTLTPTKFIQLFSTVGYGNNFAKANAALDIELGPLWEPNEVNTLMLFFYDGCRQGLARVV